MKKLFVCLLTVFLAATCLTGCGKEKSTAANRLEEILERGYITIATEPYFAPNEFINPKTDEIVGADIEFAKYLGEKLGVEVQIVPLEFTEVLTSVQNGKYDLAISALGWKKDREEAMNLSNPYYTSDENKGYGMVCRVEDKDNLKTADAYAGKTLIVQKGSMQEEFILDQIPSYKELKYLASMNDSFLAVAEGKADAAACAIGMAELFIEQNPDLGLAIASEFKFVQAEKQQGTIIGIMKGEDELTDKVNEIIAEFKTTGQFKKWVDEYSDLARSLGVE